MKRCDGGKPRMFPRDFWQRILVDRSKTLGEDRASEIRDYFNLRDDQFADFIKDMEELRKFYKKAAIDRSDDKKLIEDYRSRSHVAVTSHMLNYHRYLDALELLKWFEKAQPDRDRRDIRVLDYGCGVADYALSFAVYGYNVTLCDFEGGNLEFARWRFNRRKLPYNMIPVSLNNMYPDIGQRDLIIAGEALEHIRDPLRIVRIFHTAQSAGGYLWVSGYPFTERAVEGDHLLEAYEARGVVQEFLENNYRHVESRTGGFLLQKTPAR